MRNKFFQISPPLQWNHVPIAIKYHPKSESVTIWHSTQTPHRTRSELASILNIDKERIRVIAPQVGGAFGLKSSIYPEEVFAVWAAIKHRRNVKWIASRTEEFFVSDTWTWNKI